MILLLLVPGIPSRPAKEGGQSPGAAAGIGRLDVEKNEIVLLEDGVGEGPLERDGGLAGGVGDHHDAAL